MTPAEQYLRARQQALDALAHAVRMLGELDPDDQAREGWELQEALVSWEMVIDRLVAYGLIP